MCLSLMILLLILASDIIGIRGQGFPLFHTNEHILTNMPAEHREVLVSFYYPDLQHKRGRKLPVGVPVTVLCHFANEGDTPLNITGIMGSLNKYNNFYHYVHNTSFEAISHILRPAEEITLTHTFLLPGWLDTTPRYKMSNTVFYHEYVAPGFDQYRGAEYSYSHTFQNSTVELFSTSPELDAETAGMLLLAFGFTSLVAYLTSLACSSQAGGGGKRRKRLLNLFLFNRGPKDKGKDYQESHNTLWAHAQSWYDYLSQGGNLYSSS